MASSSSNGSLLPYELLESVLLRVPAESLNRFKSTCKRWYALFKEKTFAYNHLDLVQEHFIRITNIVQLQTINPSTNACSSLQLPNELQGRHNLSDMIHCDGLLLCTFHSPNELAVWNPCFNQVRWIIKDTWSYATNDIYGLGYDESVSRDNYKILRFYNASIFESHPTDHDHHPEVEIYEFKTSSWRTLDISLDWLVYSPCTSVSLKGNMYWVAENDHGVFLQCFDFSSEKFKHVCLAPFDNDEYDNVTLSAYGEDKLSLLHQRVYYELEQLGNIDVWITNSVKDEVVYWTKLFSVSRPDRPQLYFDEDPPHPVYFVDQSNRINVICSEKFLTNGREWICVNLYIIGKDKIQKKEIEGHYVDENMTYRSGYVYLPSLVPVP